MNFNLNCRVCGQVLKAADAPELCATCAASASVATPEHAVQAKIEAVPVGAVREGTPPLQFPAPHSVDIRRGAPGWIIIAGGSLGLLTVLGLLVPLLLKSREAAARTRNTNNLMNIGLAMHGFHDQHKRLPFNGTKPAMPGDPTSGSWAFQILPFIDQKPLFDQPNTATPLPHYMCASRGRPSPSRDGAWTDFFINPWLNDPNGVVDAPDIRRTLVGITDGTSNTIFVGQGSIDPDQYSSAISFAQSTNIFQGGNPALARRSIINQSDKAGDASLSWGCPFPQGTLMGMGDATVRTFTYRHHSGGVIRDGASSIQDNRPLVGDGQMLPDDFNWGLGIFLTPTGGETTTLPSS